MANSLGRAMNGAGDAFDRLAVHESPTHGRILEIVCDGTTDHDTWVLRRNLLPSAVLDNRPDYLVIDLRQLDVVFGMIVIGSLVEGALAMHKLGAEQNTRVLAAGPTAKRLRELLSLTKLGFLFGGEIFQDLESALRANVSKRK